jgi:hypothetical protein
VIGWGGSRRVLLRAASLTAVVLVAVALGAMPAAAVPPNPLAPPKGVEALADMITYKQGNQVNDPPPLVVCTSWRAPDPQYSPNPSRVHYGVQIHCQRPETLHLGLQLENQLPNIPWEPADVQKNTNPVGTDPWIGGDIGCFNGASAKWRMKFWGSSSGPDFGVFIPDPAYSPPVTLPCH